MVDTTEASIYVARCDSSQAHERPSTLRRVEGTWPHRTPRSRVITPASPGALERHLQSGVTSRNCSGWSVVERLHARLVEAAHPLSDRPNNHQPAKPQVENQIETWTWRGSRTDASPRGAEVGEAERQGGKADTKLDPYPFHSYRHLLDSLPGRVLIREDDSESLVAERRGDVDRSP